MPNLRISVEGRRGCGWRKPGGIYLIAPPPDAPCGKLPIPLETCPTCGEGWRPSRAPRWVDSDKLKAVKKCQLELSAVHLLCPLGENLQTGRALLIWVGEEHYATPDEFLREAQAQGISRRLASVPRDFELGKTWVFLAHRVCITQTCENCFGGGCEKCAGKGLVMKPGLFTFLRPTALEYVVTGKETEEELTRLEERGLSLVQVVRSESGSLFEDEEVTIQ